MNIPAKAREYREFIQQVALLLDKVMELNAIPEDNVVSSNVAAIKNATGFQYDTEVIIFPHGKLVKRIEVRCAAPQRFKVFISASIQKTAACQLM